LVGGWAFGKHDGLEREVAGRGVRLGDWVSICVGGEAGWWSGGFGYLDEARANEGCAWAEVSRMARWGGAEGVASVLHDRERAGIIARVDWVGW